MLKKLKVNIFSILFVSASLCSITIFTIKLTAYLKNRALEFENVLEDRNYHILVTGDYENALFLSQVFEGADSISANYNSIVELYVPNSYAQNETLQHLFDYVSFANADAVIAYFPQNENLTDLVMPEKKDSQPIPIITIGNYHPQIPQVAYIGINYSEMGKKTAEEAIMLAKSDGVIFLLQGDLGNSSQTSSFMNTFYSVLGKDQDSNPVLNIIDSVPREYELMEKYDIQSGQKVVFITMNEYSTVQTSQILSAYNDIPSDIISVGTSEITENLFNRGKITEIIAVDPKKIGQLAISEIFEYFALHNSNNYLNAEIQIRKAVK
jgi:ribose transport system substrate-binding protein